jgi:diguanylate cyclase (GGDEF)-like protein/PAS domain S-box-containing protein
MHRTLPSLLVLAVDISDRHSEAALRASHDDLEQARALREIIHPDDVAKVDAAPAGQENFGLEQRILVEGEVPVIHERARIDAEGCGIGASGSSVDVTERRHVEARARQAATVFECTREGIALTDLDGTITYVNPAFTTITGYDEADVIGHTLRLLHSGRHDRAFYQDLWRSVRTTGQWQGEIWNRRKSGEICPERLTISTVYDGNGTALNYVAIFADTTQIRRSQNQLAHLAHHDALTDLPNRVLLLTRLEHALARARRDRSHGAVLFLDLDRFKNVNDSLGHPAGDELLRIAADRMKHRIRAADTLARIGGDEFVVVLEDISGRDAACDVAAKLIAALGMPFSLAHGHQAYLGASVGISLFPEHSDDAHQLIQQADTALYEAKESGRGGAQVYTPALTAAASERFSLEASLRRGLERDEFSLHYQPLVDAGGHVVGVEALLRWASPDHGNVPPNRFIPIAEDTGIIAPLGAWVLRTACAQAEAWRQRGLPLFVAVNLSPRQFRQGDILSCVSEVLADTGLPARQLELEITEGAIMADHHQAADIMAAFKSLGVRLSIDDFGTGYSSLAHLKRFPIDKLKIDRSFVQDIPADAGDMQIASTIIAMAHGLGMEVLAEGVETEAQLQYLRAQGCESFQGYHFSRPLPAKELESWLAQRAAPH